jgi:hypothetical protein
VNEAFYDLHKYASTNYNAHKQLSIVQRYFVFVIIIITQHGENMKENSFDMIKMGQPRNTCGCKHLVPVSFLHESSKMGNAGTNASTTPATA